MAGNKSTAKTDIVAFITFGVTHIPRPGSSPSFFPHHESRTDARRVEDFPIMPTEHVSLLLKPVGFFRQNPALDCPPTADKVSVNAFEKCCK